VTTSSLTYPASLDIDIDPNGFPTGVFAWNGEAGYFFWDGQQWVIEPLPDSSYVAMDLDANGVPHVVVVDNLDLLYGNRMNGPFSAASFTRIQPAEPGRADIAVDSAGNAHIVWTWQLLRHTTSADGWSTRPTLYSVDAGSAPALVWNDGRLHVLFSEGRAGYDKLLYYRWYDSTSGWSSPETVNTGLATASTLGGLAFTSTGDAWAAWSGSKAAAAMGPGTWTNLGEASPGTAIDPTIAIDENDIPHIFYDYYGIQEVSWTGSGWGAETEITSDNADERPVAAYDDNGVRHLFYFDAGTLNYLRQ
jgi:hypothetical protein